MSKEAMMKVIFTPCAQNTIVRPMAQAICLAKGGEPVEYVDTADHKTKTVTLDQLPFLDLKTKVKGKDVNVEADLVALRAHHEPILVQINVNDVEVMIDANTTVDQAMDQFRKKLNESMCIAHHYSPKRVSPRQYTKE